MVKKSLQKRINAKKKSLEMFEKNGKKNSRIEIFRIFFQKISTFEPLRLKI